MKHEALLSRRPHHAPPRLRLWEAVELQLARVHEICGAARRTLAVQLAAQAGAPVIWISSTWERDGLNPCGLVRFLPPQDVLFVAAPRMPDILWSMEECLRSGTAPVVVAELPEPPGMTPVRRLHLAAETGAGMGKCRPLGLILTPGAGGAPGIETRWRMDPAHAPGKATWRLERLRARMRPPQVWRLEGGALSRWQDPSGAPRTEPAGTETTRPCRNPA